MLQENKLMVLTLWKATKEEGESKVSQETEAPL